MRFSVLWSDHAESRLALLWLNAPDRAFVTQAANRIDARLRVDADLVGESRTGKRRILHIPPLGVIFSVSVDDATALVIDVWRFEKHEK